MADGRRLPLLPCVALFLWQAGRPDDGEAPEPPPQGASPPGACGLGARRARAQEGHGGRGRGGHARADGGVFRSGEHPPQPSPLWSVRTRRYLCCVPAVVAHHERHQRPGPASRSTTAGEGRSPLFLLCRVRFIIRADYPTPPLPPTTRAQLRADLESWCFVFCQDAAGNLDCLLPQPDSAPGSNRLEGAGGRPRLFPAEEQDGWEMQFEPCARHHSAPLLPVCGRRSLRGRWCSLSAAPLLISCHGFVRRGACVNQAGRRHALDRDCTGRRHHEPHRVAVPARRGHHCVRRCGD